MAIKPTYAQVQGEGQLKLSYFPNCADAAAMQAFVEARIDDVDSEFKLTIGDWYTTSNADHILQLTKGVMYLTLGRLWQIIAEVMVGYDAEGLPPEFVEPNAAFALRDFYLDEGNKIKTRYDTDAIKEKGVFLGAFRSSGVDEDEVSILGLEY